MQYTKYQPATENTFIHVFFSFIVMFILASLLGWLYTINAIIPIVYFNVIFTIGLGFAIAISAQIIGKLFKIKKRQTRLYLVIFGALIAYYSNWVSFILFISLEDFPNITSLYSYFFYPINFFTTVFEINTYGTWAFASSYLYNNNVNGSILTIIWIIEALIIFFIPIAYTYKFPENPFSEKKNRWYKKLVLDYEFASVYSDKRFIEELKKEGIELILTMERGLPYKYAKVSIFFLQGEDDQYLAIDNIFIEVRNKSKKNVTHILKPIKITNEEANKLISKFGTKKEFFLDF